jgi:hypothetical protein
MGRSSIIGSAIREIRTTLGMDLPLQGIRLPIPGDGSLPSLLFRKEKR